MRRIDYLRHGRFQRRLVARGGFEGSDAAGIDVGAEEGEHRFRVGKEHATIAALFPNVSQRPQLQIEIDPAGQGQFELVNFLRLVAVRGGADAVGAGRQ